MHHQRRFGQGDALWRQRRRGALAPHLARVATGPALARAFDFIAGNDQFFLNVAMAMAKSMLDPAQHIADCTVLTAMARNGTDFGIRVSALGERWFSAPVEMPKGLYFPGYSAADANPDMGDSAILETAGFGAFAMAAAPAGGGVLGGG